MAGSAEGVLSLDELRLRRARERCAARVAILGTGNMARGVAARALAGAVLVDVTNPVDASIFEPLDVAPFHSGAAVIAAAAPEDARVGKAFNTTFAGPLLAGLVVDGGMRPIDAGSIHRARELEALGFLHMAVQGPLGTRFASAVKVLEARA